MDPSGTMVAKKCLFSGIYWNEKKYYGRDFSNTFMKFYLDTYFAKQIEPTERFVSREAEESIEEKSKSKRKGLNNLLKSLDEVMEPTPERRSVKKIIVDEYRKTHPKINGGR